MTERLTQEQLTQIVGEVERLAQRQQNEVDRQQVEQILQELNLPPELLDEAILQVKRREVLATQQRRRRNLTIGMVAALIITIAAGAFWSHQSQQRLANVSAQQGRITLAQNPGGSLTTVTRPAEVAYYVTLQNAPIGKKLGLSCNWTALGDQLMHQNRYQTQEITTSVWNTRCKHTIDSAAPAGTWTVRMFLGDRPISETTFEVK